MSKKFTNRGETELKIKELIDLLKTRKIEFHFFTTEYPETKAGIVKLFQITLKNSFFCYLLFYSELHLYSICITI